MPVDSRTAYIVFPKESDTWHADLLFPAISETYNIVSPDSQGYDLEDSTRTGIHDITVNRLGDRLQQAHQFALTYFPNIDKTQLYQAFRETWMLSSYLFSDNMPPSITVDPHGEFTMSYRSHCGYIDIGTNGTGELSYHVRNDVQPDASIFDDIDWSDHRIPMQLVKAIEALMVQMR